MSYELSVFSYQPFLAELFVEDDLAQGFARAGVRLKFWVSNRGHLDHTIVIGYSQNLSHFLSLKQAHVDGPQSQSSSRQHQVFHGQGYIEQAPVSFISHRLALKTAGNVIFSAGHN